MNTMIFPCLWLYNLILSVLFVHSQKVREKSLLVWWDTSIKQSVFYWRRWGPEVCQGLWVLRPFKGAVFKWGIYIKHGKVSVLNRSRTTAEILHWRKSFLVCRQTLFVMIHLVQTYKEKNYIYYRLLQLYGIDPPYVIE